MKAAVQTSARKRRSSVGRYPGYVPLEEWLATPRVRVLRVMRFFPDGATATDIFDALDLPTYDAGRSRERINHMAAIRRAVEAGELEVACTHRRVASSEGRCCASPRYRLKAGFDVAAELPQFRETR